MIFILIMPFGMLVAIEGVEDSILLFTNTNKTRNQENTNVIFQLAENCSNEK